MISVCLPAEALAKAGRSSCRDKIEFQFAVPKKGENQLFSSCDYGSPASGRVNNVAIEKGPSTAKNDFFARKYHFAGCDGPRRRKHLDPVCAGFASQAADSADYLSCHLR